MNPPFKNMKAFIKKAYEERSHSITVCLIPARTNTRRKGYDNSMLTDEEVKIIKDYQKGFGMSTMAQHIDALLKDREELKQEVHRLQALCLSKMNQLHEAHAVIEFYASDAFSSDAPGDNVYEDGFNYDDKMGTKARAFLTKYQEGE